MSKQAFDSILEDSFNGGLSDSAWFANLYATFKLLSE